LLQGSLSSKRRWRFDEAELKLKTADLAGRFNTLEPVDWLSSATCGLVCPCKSVCCSTMERIYAWLNVKYFTAEKVSDKLAHYQFILRNKALCSNTGIKF